MFERRGFRVKGGLLHRRGQEAGRICCGNSETKLGRFDGQGVRPTLPLVNIAAS